MSKFNKDYPHINVKIFESDKDEIARLVQQNEVDIGLIGIRDNESIDDGLQLHSLNKYIIQMDIVESPLNSLLL